MSGKRKVASSVRVDVRNKLRPLFRVNGNPTFWKQIQAIRQCVRPSEWALALPVVEQNPYYPFEGIGACFPTNGRFAPDPRFRRLAPLRCEAELMLVSSRLNFHADRVLEGLDKIRAANQYFYREDYSSAALTLKELRLAHGLSFVGMKKELYALSCQYSLAGLLRQLRLITEDQESTAWALLARVAYDMADPTNDAARSSRMWLRMSRSRLSAHDWYARIIYQEISGRSSEDEISARALRYSGLSLIDLAFEFWKISSQFPHLDAVSTAWKALDQRLRSFLTDHFTRLPLSVPEIFKREPEAIRDVELYRLSFFFGEITALGQWRATLSQLLFPPLAQVDLPLPENIIAIIQSVNDTPNDFTRLVAELRGWQRLPFASSATVCDQELLKTAIAAASIRVGNTTLTAPQEHFHTVLANAPNIHQFLSEADLTKLADRSPDASPLFMLIVREMIFRSNRSLDNDLERRLAFMLIFLGKDRSAIVPFLDDLSSRSISTALLIARTCSRAFLERLFMLMTSLKDVLEARIQICTWLERMLDDSDESLREERESLERELSNLDARSDLDSTRVHVDEEGLREWFIQTQGGVATRYRQTVLAEGANAQQRSTVSLLSSLQRKVSNDDKSSNDEEDLSSETVVGSEVLYVAIVEETIKAFANDRSFGLDAYLSRRIRHGTLSGQIMTPVTKSLRRVPELINLYRSVHAVPESTQAQELIDNLIRSLAASLDLVRRDIIQLESEKHPNGLIRATWRTVSNAAHMDATIARVRQRVTETRGTYDIFDETYALCWACIEQDLAQLRLHMLRRFLPNAIQMVTVSYDQLSHEDQKSAQVPFLEALATLEARVHEVCGWFIRPVFRQNSYDLRILINSTFSIVHELDENYRFKEMVSMDHDISLSRGSFDIIGDALYVLIGNAAKHGLSDGIVLVSVEHEERNKLAVINVKSSVSDEAAIFAAGSRIKDALKARAASDRAAVEEGFSGLGKLAGIVARVRTDEALLEFHAEVSEMTINFKFILPQDLSVYRVTA